MEGRYWHVSFDAKDPRGESHGDVTYVTGPEGMTLAHLDAIKNGIKAQSGVDFVRIGFFAELAA